MSTRAARPSPLAERWQRLHPRERRLVLLAATVVGVALLWWLALAPALTTLRQAPAQRAQVEAEWQQMQQLRQQAEALKASPKIAHDEALRALEASVKERLGASGQLTVLGERATVTLKGAGAAALADWLAQARANARATPVEARLTRSADTAPGAAAQWDGAITLALPPR